MKWLIVRQLLFLCLIIVNFVPGRMWIIVPILDVTNKFDALLPLKEKQVKVTLQTTYHSYFKGTLADTPVMP